MPATVTKIGIISVFVFGFVLAQNYNTYQPPRPFNTNAVPRAGITPLPTPVPVTFDVAAGISITNNTTASQAFVETASADRVLVVGVSFQDNLNCTICAGTISAITYGAQALTLLSSQNQAPVTNEIWYKIAPLTGSNTFAITFTDVVDAGVGLTSFFNVNQSTPFGTVVCELNSIAITDPDITIPSTVDNLVWDHLTVNTGASGTVSVGPNQTSMWNVQPGLSGSRINGSGSRENAGGAVVMSWTLGTAKKTIQCGMEIRK